MLVKEIENIIPTVNYFVDRVGSSNWKIIKSKINFHDLTYIYKGNVTYIVNNIVMNAREGHFVYIPKGSIREAYTYKENPLHAFSCNFFCHINGNFNIELPLPTIFRIGKTSELTELYKFLNNSWVEKGFAYEFKSRALFMLILHKIVTILNYSDMNIKFDKRIKFIKEYIINNYFNELDLKFLASLVDLNPIYLGTLFKKCTGLSIKEYIRKIRVNSAENLLLISGNTVSETAYQCGFKDVYYFSKIYKMYKGYPPSKLLKDRIKKV
ncbi:MAG: AraC family transcriptional regulator [Clostridiales bacterium]